MGEKRSIISENFFLLAAISFSVAAFFLLFGIYVAKRQTLSEVIDKELVRRASVVADSFSSVVSLPFDEIELQGQIDSLTQKISQVELIFIAVPQQDKFRVIASSTHEKIGTVTSTPLMSEAWKDKGVKTVLEYRQVGQQGETPNIQLGSSLVSQRIFEGAFPVASLGTDYGILFLRFSFEDLDRPIAAIMQRETTQFIVFSAIIVPLILFLGFWGNYKGARVRQLTVLGKQKDALLSFAAHELNTPMGYIRSVLSLLAREQLSGRGRELLERASTSLHQLINLVENLLTVARLEAGRLEIYPRPIHMEDILSPLIPQYQKLAQEKGLSLSYTAPAAPTFKVIADPDKISEVVGNFLSNAIKYTQRGGISVSVSEGGGLITVSVADTGLGIADADREKLFTQFGRTSRTKDIKGTGLGLYISNLIVKEHRGSIKVESQPGRGSVFSVSLPVARRLPKTESGEPAGQTQTKDGGAITTGTKNTDSSS